MPLTKDEAQGVVRLFTRDYPGALELAYKFRNNTTELYGPRASEVPPGMKGGYISKETAHAGRRYRGRVEVPLENMTDARDLLLTLRHEVLGHYGANTFVPGEKRALLDGLIAAREEPSLKPLWADIDDRYAGRSLDMRAEEVYALHCEGVAPSHHVGTDQAPRGQRAFQETCLAPVRLMRADDLQSIACMVAQGMHDRTRTQQTFPALNELFRKKENDMEPKKPFHETVAEKLIEKLKEGTAPWQKPWQAGDPGAVMPINPTTGKRYKGINAIHLMSQGYTDQRWMTYKQASAVDAQVRKGEKGTPIQYWKFTEEQDQIDANGKPVLDFKGEPIKQLVKLERPRVFFATVFNAEQIDRLPALPPRRQQDWNPVERAEQILQASGAVIKHGEQNRAFYRPATDSIHLPDKGQFPTADNYYATALHELGHWTGHESRLDRDLVHPFGSEGYAKEELRAEIASMILGDELGIGHDPGQHLAYVASWIKALEEDPLEIFRAASDAEKIQDYVLSLEQKQVQEQSTPQNQVSTQEAAMPLPPEEAAQDLSIATEKTWLAVPFEQHKVVKQLAGKLPDGSKAVDWDKLAKCWYANPGADLNKLKLWLTDNSVTRQRPAMAPEVEFAEALGSLGCVVAGEHPIMDGKKHRISVEGEKYSENAGSGFYVGHLDGHPAGYIKNNKTGIEMKWKSKGYVLDPEQKARMQAEAATKLQARETEQSNLQEQAAQRVGRQMADLIPVTQPTPYMQAKGIEPHAGVLTDKEGQKTYIPATDENGKQWTMQYIQEDGTKRFAKDSRKEGCFHVVGGLETLAKAPVLVIGEGYATAGSLSQSLGFATVAAFDSGNLVHVVKALHAKFPDKPIVIAGDDDKHLEATQGVNPGRSKAEEAAKAIGGKVLLPIFAPGEQAANPKGFTDFNDLANKSALGQEGIDRQVRLVVDSVIEKHHARRVEEQQQERAQRQEQLLRRAAKIG